MPETAPLSSMRDDDLDYILINRIETPEHVVKSLTRNDKEFSIREALRTGVVSLVAILPPPVISEEDPADTEETYGTVWFNTSTGFFYQTPGKGLWEQLNPMAEDD